MSSLILARRSSRNPILRRHFKTCFLSSDCHLLSPSNHRLAVLASGHSLSGNSITGSSSVPFEALKFPYGSDSALLSSIGCRLFGSPAAASAAEPSTSDGLTVEGIIANEWTILEESESDWKSHASAIARSIHLIKKRLQWKKLRVRLELLSSQLDKPDLWDDPVHAGKISREHGSLSSKMKDLKAFEEELLEHIDMINLAREENDADLELVGPQFF